MANHLAGQSSPYLLQHADNPVEWYPWCDEAFEKAVREDKPVFLSIGYSTCHWCHVMEHESFENREIAEVMNKYFVSVKVDREERPDLDSVYMSVCQNFTGGGGWPMSIFMTPQQKPFFAGTYFPPETRYGRAGFKDLLLVIAGQWKEHREELLQSAEIVLSYLKEQEKGSRKAAQLMQAEAGSTLADRAVSLFMGSFDAKNGGFGTAPKFPIPHNLIFLLLYAQVRAEPGQRKEIVRQACFTLERMRRGGIFDQIGYGFSRYSTDARYLVPHFEKMLYDNAMLIIAYCAAYKASGEKMFLDTAKQCASYLFREMANGEGAFYSAQDADSNGGEGRFYTWQYDEVLELLGKEEGRRFCRAFGVTEEGNFEGTNILNRLEETGGSSLRDFARERKILYAYRRKRAKLHLDDKILTSWNSLAICALSVLYKTTGSRKYLDAAVRAERFIEEKLTEGSLLYVSWRNGRRSSCAFLDEYAFYTAALISLHEADKEKIYLKRAEQVLEAAQEQFADQQGGCFLYGSKNSALITRPKETADGALPSGNSVMAYCLVRLAQLSDKEVYRQRAEQQLRFMCSQAQHYPAGYSMFLIAQLFYDYPPQKITVVLPGWAGRDGDGGEKKSAREKTAVQAMQAVQIENAGTVQQVAEKMPLYADITVMEAPTQEYPLINGQTTYYVCRNHTCLAPTNEAPSVRQINMPDKKLNRDNRMKTGI